MLPKKTFYLIVKSEEKKKEALVKSYQETKKINNILCKGLFFQTMPKAPKTLETTPRVFIIN